MVKQEDSDRQQKEDFYSSIQYLREDVFKLKMRCVKVWEDYYRQHPSADSSGFSDLFGAIYLFEKSYVESVDKLLVDFKHISNENKNL